MKRTLITYVLLLTLFVSAQSQNQKPTFASNPTLNFEKFISGIKYAEIGLNTLNQEEVDKQIGIAGFYYLAQKYLLEMGFEYVALTSTEKTELDISIKSYCEYSHVMFGGDISKNAISNLTISFVSCNGDIFTFASDKNFKYGRFADVQKKLTAEWQSIVKTKGTYKPANQLSLPSNPTNWTKDKIARYYNENKSKLEPIEGIYERVRLSFEDITGGKYTVGIIKNPEDDGFLVIYLFGAKNASDWQTGEVKAALHETATKGFYSVEWISRDKSLYEDVYCNIDKLGFNVYSSGIQPISYKFIKLSPLK